MNDVKLELSNGFIAYIKPFCSRKLYKEIQIMSFNDTEIKGSEMSADFGKLTGSLAEADDYTVFSMIRTLEDEKGNVIELSLEYIEGMSQTIFSELLAEVAKITNPDSKKTTEEDKKEKKS